MSAYDSTLMLQARIAQRTGISVSFEDAETLRRCQMTLHRWSELECGDGNDYRSWAIERNETTGKPFMVNYWHDGRTTRTRIADREAGALRRIATICQHTGLHYYHQTDPRGCALYVSAYQLSDDNYSNGVSCA